MNYKNWKKIILKNDSTISDVIKNLNKSSAQIVLVVNKKKKIFRYDYRWGYKERIIKRSKPKIKYYKNRKQQVLLLLIMKLTKLRQKN